MENQIIGFINSSIKGLKLVTKQEVTEQQAHKIIDSVVYSPDLNSLVKYEVIKYCVKNYNYKMTFNN